MQPVCVQIIGQGQLIQIGETRSIYGNLGRVEPVNTNWGSKPVNTNWGPRLVNTNWGPGLVNTNLVSGPRARARVGGQAKGWGPGNTNTPSSIKLQNFAGMITSK